jgi:hypothetical protein
MRELTKSTLSAGLAMSVFGMQTMMNAFRRSQPGGPNSAVQGLDSITQAMIDNTSSNLRETFQAADKVQRDLVDLTFRFMTLGAMRPGSGTSSLSDAAKQATDRLRQWMGDARGPGCGCAGSGSQISGAAPARSPAAAPAQGWGPMPNQS